MNIINIEIDLRQYLSDRLLALYSQSVNLPKEASLETLHLVYNLQGQIHEVKLLHEYLDSVIAKATQSAENSPHRSTGQSQDNPRPSIP